VTGEAGLIRQGLAASALRRPARLGPLALSPSSQRSLQPASSSRPSRTATTAAVRLLSFRELIRRSQCLSWTFSALRRPRQVR